MIILKRLCAARNLRVDRPNANRPLPEAEVSDLVAMPGDQGGVDGDETDDGDLHGGTTLHQPQLLKVSDQKGVVSLLLGLDRMADGLVRAAEFAQRAEIAIRGRDPVDLKAHAGLGVSGETVGQSVDVLRLLLRFNQPRLSHRPRPADQGVFGRSPCKALPLPR